MRDIKPALTAEEWANPGPHLYRADDDTPEAWHKAAALYLHGQPFGFTREDVVEVRDAIDAVETYILEGSGGSLLSIQLVDAGTHPSILRLRSLADRIAALLPPETT